MEKTTNGFLQSLAAAFYVCNVIFYGECLLIIMYITFFTKYWPILLVFMFWTWYDRETPHRGGRQFWVLRGFPLLRYFRDYFPMSLVKTTNLDQNRNYIFGSHPHGLLSASNFGNFLISYSQREDLFPGLSFFTAVSDFNFQYPVLREVALGWGLVSASQRSLKYILNDDNKGNVVNLIIGGADEICYMKTGQYKIILKKRKGFVKIALNTGCCLVPVIHFGENDIFDVVTLAHGSLMHKLQQWLKSKTGMNFVIPVGRSGILKFLPNRMPVTSVVGKPIEVPKVNEPTQDQIEHYHTLYTEELMKLFNEHKYKYVENPESTHLIIAE